MKTTSNPEAVITPAQVRALCLLYRAVIDAGLVEGMVNEDQAASALLPPAPPDTLALLGAQTAITKMVLDNWCPGGHAEILGDLRKHVLAYLAGDESK